MAFKLIALDLDGTLLSPHGNVTARVKEAVHRVLASGVLVCFATGRSSTESRMVLEAIEHFDHAVFVGGAIVIDTKRQVTLHRTLMEPALAAEVCRLLEDSGHAVLALQDTQACGIDYLISGDFEPSDSTKLWMAISKAIVHRVKRLGDHQHEHTIRLGIVAPAAETAKVQKKLGEKFAGRVFCHSIAVTGPSAQGPAVDVLEIFDPSVNKWEGIMHVARAHGIAAREIIAVGDDLNDLHMLQNAGLGVAMGNAHPRAKAAAKRVIGSNREEGLAAFLDELVETGALARDVA
jgi:Cof subfamily protein (haloacid dehalogenase superfamily)